MGFLLIWWLVRDLGLLTVRNVWVFGKSRLGLYQGGFSQTLDGDHQDENPQNLTFGGMDGI